MATYVRGNIGAVQRGETKNDRRKLPFVVGTDEAQTVTVRKPGEASFETAGDTNATAAQIEGTVYELLVHPDDLGGVGTYVYKCAGSTDTQYVWVTITEFDPYVEGSLSDLALKHRASTPG
jgi:hypothetical protein